MPPGDEATLAVGAPVIEPEARDLGVDLGDVRTPAGLKVEEREAVEKGRDDFVPWPLAARRQAADFPRRLEAPRLTSVRRVAPDALTENVGPIMELMFGRPEHALAMGVLRCDRNNRFHAFFSPSQAELYLLLIECAFRHSSYSGRAASESG
jgi:hypothetical protein